VKNIFINKKGLSAKYIYSLITSRAISIFITYHLHSRQAIVHQIFFIFYFL